ncbi:MAG: M1 family metallopeptidase [Bacteroidales bacterium]
MKYLLLFLLGISISTNLISQNQAESKYKPADLFPAVPIIPPGNPYRSASGEPGEAYWQNRADYVINAALDDTRNTISGTVTITYTNNCPQALSFLWLQLDQNAFRENSRALGSQLTTDSLITKSKKKYIGGYQIEHIQIIKGADNQAKNTDATYLVTDTRMQLFLPEPLPSGKKLTFSIKYSYTIPEYFYSSFSANRTDILYTKNGAIYSIAQWYPRLCVFDDIEGWNTLPYLGQGEFYLEYGDYLVSLTLPSAYIVEASGELINPEEVMTATQLKRWNQAHNSEQKVTIRSSEEITNITSRPSKPSCTWKYKITNSRDFAWTASKSFVWEGIRINLPSGKKAFGVSVYPIESKQPNSWERSCEYIKFSIEYFSKQWYEYPYPCAVNVASNVDGMEYPGIVFCSESDTGNTLWSVVKHELSHTWFPMIVGSNERKYGWMDEGVNVFIDNLAESSFNNGEFKGYLAEELPFEQYFSDSLMPVMTRPDGMNGDVLWKTQYLKTAYLLSLLRNQIIGADRFDFAFKKYTHDWAFKHPAPWDFFNSINNSTGEDLTWFWKAMIMENYKLDQAITGMKYVNNNPAEGALITITNLEKAAMPMAVEITTADGHKIVETFPVEIWEYQNCFVFKTKTMKEIRSIVIDPDKVFPDVNRVNNIWKQ